MLLDYGFASILSWDTLNSSQNIKPRWSLVILLSEALFNSKVRTALGGIQKFTLFLLFVALWIAT